MRAVQWRQPHQRIVLANACQPRCEFPKGSRAFVWRDGAITGLGGLERSSGRAVNNHGWVVGMHDDGPWVWADGTMVDLLPLPGATSCDVTDINDAGHVVGACYANGQRAVMWFVRVEQRS